MATAVVLVAGLLAMGQPITARADGSGPLGPLNIVTVAGRTLPIGDGGPAPSAILLNPRAVAFDIYGNLHIADQNNQRIRKVDHASGVITTVAGTGTPGYNGDNIPAANALLSNPFGLAFDSLNNLYIAEFGGHRIRKVDHATQNITTIAGTGTAGYNADNIPATQAQLNAPVSIAIDGTEALYIGDQNNNRIRKVTLATGLITTYAGTGTAGFNGDGVPAVSARLNTPHGLALDASGHLYIADLGNHRVRRVDKVSGLINTVAGTGTAGYNADGVQATAAQLSSPIDLAVDPAGHLYIAERTGHRVRRVDAMTGLIATVAGTGMPGFNGDNIAATSAQLGAPHGVRLDVSGDLYIVEQGNNDVRRVSSAVITTVAGSAVSPLGCNIATAANLFSPMAVTTGQAGAVYIPEFSGQRVRQLTATGYLTVLAGTGVVGYSGDGGPATAAGFNGPHGLGVDSAGNVYVADATNHVVRRIDHATGTVTTVAGTGAPGFNGDNIVATQAQLFGPFGVSFDDDDNLYIGERFGQRVRRVDHVTQLITTVAGTGIGGFDGDGVATAKRLNAPQRLVVDGDGSTGQIYVVDAQNHRVRKVDLATGNMTTFAGTTAGYSGDGGPATSAQFNIPFDIARDALGRTYIAEFNGNRLRMVDTAGDIHTVAGTANSGFGGDGGSATDALMVARGVAADSAGNVYLADTGANRLRRLNVAVDVASDQSTVHLNTEGDWITATIELPAPWNAGQVDPGSMRLMALDPVTRAPLGCEQPVNQLTGTALTAGPGASGTTASVRFDRDSVTTWAGTGTTLYVRVEGRFLDGRFFSGDIALAYALGGRLVGCPEVTAGTPGNDIFAGSTLADRYDGHTGNDQITGGSGDDCLLGSDGDDVITAGSGNDKVDGGPGADAPSGGSGNDLITGGDGADLVDAGTGDDVIDIRDGTGGDQLSCGSGIDRYLADPGDVIAANCETQIFELPS